MRSHTSAWRIAGECPVGRCHSKLHGPLHPSVVRMMMTARRSVWVMTMLMRLMVRMVTMMVHMRMTMMSMAVRRMMSMRDTSVGNTPWSPTRPGSLI